jgi:hypothetical protein
MRFNRTCPNPVPGVTTKSAPVLMHCEHMPPPALSECREAIRRSIVAAEWMVAQIERLERDVDELRRTVSRQALERHGAGHD